MLAHDLKLGARGLARSPGFTALAVGILALGIGSNTAVFSLTDRILLRALPVDQPERLVVLRLPGERLGRTWTDIDHGAQAFSYPFYEGLRDANRVFRGVLARFAVALSVASADQAERVEGELVSGNYFDVLGVRPALGRLLTADDDRPPGGHPVVVLSHGYWTRRFGARPTVLGESLSVAGQPMTVIGVTQAGFRGVQAGQAPDLFVPLRMQPQVMPTRGGVADPHDHWLQLMARLEPGLSREQAEAGLEPVVRELLERERDAIRDWPAPERERFLGARLSLIPGSRGRLVLQQEERGRLLILSGLVVLVLGIACANVAGLLLARGVARRREIALRLTLGARRGQLVRQLLVESLLLALGGGLVGLLVASWAIEAMRAAFPPDQAGLRHVEAGLDPRLLAFTFAVALVTALLSGLVPAWRATRSDPIEAIKEEGAGAGTGPRQARLQKSLVVVQIAVTVAPLITAGLFLRSLERLERVDLGMRVEHLLAFSIEPGRSGLEPEHAIPLVGELRRDLASLPGVTSVSAAQLAVLTDNNAGSNMTIEGFTRPEDDGFHLFHNWVGPQYFATLGVPLLAGREFVDSDVADGPKVAVINETTARECFAGRNPLGMHLASGSGSVQMDIEIVGVVADSKHAHVRQEARPFVFLPYAQNPEPVEATFYLRSSLPPSVLAPAVRQAVRRREARLPVFALKTVSRQLDESLSGERFLASLALRFGALAALLAAIGLYSVMAYTVARRTREMGIRMALGAGRTSVRGLVLGEAAKLTAVGLALGLPLGLGAGRLAASLLYEVPPHDPLPVAGAGLLLAAVMAVAAYVPARRATRVDPAVALRCE